MPFTYTPYLQLEIPVEDTSGADWTDALERNIASVDKIPFLLWLTPASNNVNTGAVPQKGKSSLITINDNPLYLLG
jgi:hypothetical protein